MLTIVQASAILNQIWRDLPKEFVIERADTSLHIKPCRPKDLSILVIVYCSLAGIIVVNGDDEHQVRLSDPDSFAKVRQLIIDEIKLSESDS